MLEDIPLALPVRHERTPTRSSVGFVPCNSYTISRNLPMSATPSPSLTPVFRDRVLATTMMACIAILTLADA